LEFENLFQSIQLDLRHDRRKSPMDVFDYL
jgi:hypothetical protein